jgi:iron complex outermembrane receptor protein
MTCIRTRAASRILSLGWSVSAFTLAAFAAPALAQTNPATTDADGASSGVDEIVVTAQRRTESLQDVPVAVTALSSDVLEDRLIGNVIDVAAQVPNLTIEPVTGLGSSARVFLRGVGEDQAQFTADPAVGIYVDGVYYARTNGALFDFADIERVEVLRGPQGTLYGRNTPGGAINIITRKPDPKAFGLRGEMTYGRFDQLEAKAAVNGPLSDTMAVTVSVLAKTRDGLSYARGIEREVGERSVFSGRASLGWAPTAAVDLRLTVDHTIDDSDTSVPTSNFTGPPADLFLTGTDIDPKGELRSTGVALHGSLALGDVTLSSISAYRKLDQVARLDNDGEVRLLSGFESDARQSQVSQEFTASLNRKGLDAILGVFFFDENNEYDALTLIGSRANAAVRIVRPDFSTQYTRSYAVFGQATLEVLPDLRVTLGGRYSGDRKRYTNIQPAVNATYRASKKWTDFSPKVAVDYRLTPDVLIYASFAEGYKAGGFNRSTSRVVAETPYDLESVRSYETGIKTELFDRRVRFNLTGFYNDYTDLQLSTFDPGTGTTRRFNAAQATTKGVEAELSARPVRGLDVYGMLAYLDAQYDEFVDLVGGQLVDVSFRKLKGAPKWQYTAGFAWDAPLNGGENGSLRLAAEAAYRDKVFNNVANTEAIATKARTLVNASIGYSTPNERWTFIASGKNLLDRKYAANGIFIGGLLSALYPADPLTWSLTARYRF